MTPRKKTRHITEVSEAVVSLRNYSPSAVLEEIGHALYGERWKKPLADALGVHENQIRRWVKNGTTLKPDNQLFKDAVGLLRAQRDEWRLDASIAHCLAMSLDAWRKLP